MFAWHRPALATPLLGGFLIAAACSGSGDRTPADSTSGAAASSPATDTMNARSTSTAGADTVTGPTDTGRTVQTQSAGVAQVPPPKPRVRPSIDPGRKAPAATPAPAAPAPSSDTAAAPTKPAPTSAQGQAVKYDASTNTVTFDLIGGPNGFQFNGYSSGGATLTLPPKANVVISFINKDGTPHSAEVISGEGSLPNAAVDAALPRAYTNQLLQGLPQEGSDDMRFQAPENGTFRIFCGVPGHGLSGMWIWMKVDPAAKAPSFGPTKA